MCWATQMSSSKVNCDRNREQVTECDGIHLKQLPEMRARNANVLVNLFCWCVGWEGSIRNTKRDYIIYMPIVFFYQIPCLIAFVEEHCKWGEKT